jgi:predicted Zn-dependent protease
MKSIVLYLGVAILLLLCVACPLKSPSKKNEQKKSVAVVEQYHFKYQTIISNLERDCADSKLDESLHWLSNQEENLLRPIKISLEDEQKIGAQVHQCLAQNGFVEGAGKQRVQAIVDKMKPFMTRKDLDLKVNVVDMPCQNAFACPGGYVYVTLPLLESLDNNALSCVIGHELCHLENKHCNIHIKKYKFMGSVLTNLFSCLTQSLSQRNELEADLGGLYLAAKAGFDPKSAAKTFETWSNLEPKPTTLGKIFRSHPYALARAQCINAYLKDAKKKAEGLARMN